MAQPILKPCLAQISCSIQNFILFSSILVDFAANQFQQQLEMSHRVVDVTERTVQVACLHEEQIRLSI